MQMPREDAADGFQSDDSGELFRNEGGYPVVGFFVRSNLLVSGCDNLASDVLLFC